MAGGQRLISWLHPCSISNVALNTRTCAHGPSKLVGCDIQPPSKNPTSSSVQLTRPVSAHTPYRVPHPRPTRASICPHTDQSKCPGTFPLSARPYVQCRPIFHVVCPISGPHAPCALCMHTDPYAQSRGSALIPFVTPCPPKTHRTAQPFRRGEHTYTEHPTYTFFLASCKRVNPRVVWLVDKGL
jgi:hypothetical protein